jgi:envelope integrity protein B
MNDRPGRLLGLVACVAVLFAGSAGAVPSAGSAGSAPLAAGVAGAAEIAPHRALYSMTLAQTKNNSGVVAARGTMVYEWGETCDGWTVEQRYRLRMQYSEAAEVEVSSNFVTWESKDGLSYRFNERKLRNGEVDEDVRGDARLDGPGKGGYAEFTKPQPSRIELAPGTLFPTAHTLFLIDRAKADEQFVARNVFDGAGDDRSVEISAVIGQEQSAEATASEGGVDSPLLKHPSWRIRLAFFPSDSKSDKPDYELGMRLLDNGVSRDMTLDYGDFAIRAKLDEIEALPKPNC